MPRGRGNVEHRLNDADGTFISVKMTGRRDSRGIGPRCMRQSRWE